VRSKELGEYFGPMKDLTVVSRSFLKIEGPFSTYSLTRSAGRYGLPAFPVVPMPNAMIPPVDVPATRSKTSCKCLPTPSSIAARIVAGMIPRIPPPSIESTLIRLI
jgi:hypothetical protein